MEAFPVLGDTLDQSSLMDYPARDGLDTYLQYIYLENCSNCTVDHKSGTVPKDLVGKIPALERPVHSRPTRAV